MANESWLSTTIPPFWYSSIRLCVINAVPVVPVTRHAYGLDSTAGRGYAPQPVSAATARGKHKLVRIGGPCKAVDPLVIKRNPLRKALRSPITVGWRYVDICDRVPLGPRKGNVVAIRGIRRVAVAMSMQRRSWSMTVPQPQFLQRGSEPDAPLLPWSS